MKATCLAWTATGLLAAHPARGDEQPPGNFDLHGHFRSGFALNKHFLPLIGCLLPAAVITYGVVIPRSCVAGVNELTIGIGMNLVGAAVTYVLGVRAAKR
jgi:hypothetical protein